MGRDATVLSEVHAGKGLWAESWSPAPLGLVTTQEWHKMNQTTPEKDQNHPCKKSFLLKPCSHCLQAWGSLPTAMLQLLEKTPHAPAWQRAAERI